jgi:hypothetical protein
MLAEIQFVQLCSKTNDPKEVLFLEINIEEQTKLKVIPTLQKEGKIYFNFNFAAFANQRIHFTLHFKSSKNTEAKGSIILCNIATSSYDLPLLSSKSIISAYLRISVEVNYQNSQ